MIYQFLYGKLNKLVNCYICIPESFNTKIFSTSNYLCYFPTISQTFKRIFCAKKKYYTLVLKVSGIQIRLRFGISKSINI